MTGFKNKLSQLIRKDLGLGAAAEAEIMSLVHGQKSPGTVARILTHLSQLKKLWTFPLEEKKRILEGVCTALSDHSRSDMVTRLITIVFSHPASAGAESSGISNFINLMKTSMDSEAYVRVTVGLARAMLLTLKRYPVFIREVDVQTVAPSLLFERDSVSYAASLTHLISLFGASSVIPFAIDLLIRHPGESNLFLINTLFEYARRLPQGQKAAAFKQLPLLLMTHKGRLSEKTIVELYNGCVPELGRLYYLSAVGPEAEQEVVHTPSVTTAANKRLLSLQQSRRGDA